MAKSTKIAAHARAKPLASPDHVYAKKLKNGDWIVLKETPCRVMDVSFTKAGHTDKAHIVGLSVEGKKVEDLILENNQVLKIEEPVLAIKKPDSNLTA